jgi:alpha-glucosidase
MIEYTDGPDRYHTAYTFVFLRDEFGAAFIRARVEEFFARSRTAWPTWAFSNHDVQRVVSRWGRGAADAGALAKCLIALLTSLKGSICLYQGEELGLPQAEVPFERLVDPEDRAFWPRAKRDGARTPMPWVAEAPFAGFSRCEPWLPVDPRHPPLAVDRQEADGASTLAFTRSWLAFRRAQPSLKWGDIAFLDAPEPLLVFTRSQQVDQGTDRLVLAFNLSPQSVDCHLELDGRLAPLALPQRLGGSVVTGERRMISLPGWGVAICRVLGT